MARRRDIGEDIESWWEENKHWVLPLIVVGVAGYIAYKLYEKYKPE